MFFFVSSLENLIVSFLFIIRQLVQSWVVVEPVVRNTLLASLFILLHLSSDNSGHLIDEVHRLQPESSACDSDNKGSLRNWDSSDDKVGASNTSGDQIKENICSFSDLVQHSVSHLQGSNDSSKVHWEIGDLGHEESQKSGCGVISDLTSDHSKHSGSVMDHQTHISESIIHASQEIVEEIGT